MQTRSIGALDASVVGLGCNNFGGRIDEAATKRVVDAALDAGVTLFDTADIYGGTKSEEFLGRSLAGRRDRALIATKFGGPIDDEHPGGASASYVARACEDSLRRLATDHIDLYQIHFPDQATPLEETLGALDELVRAGKVREIGCSNFSVELIESAARISAENGWARFVSVQNEYSLLRRGPEKQGVLDACAKHDIAFIPYFPLASGVLSGKYERGAPPPAGTRLAGLPAERAEQALSDTVMNRVDGLSAWATAQGHTLLELAFAWLLARPVVGSVIAGATKPEQVAANAAASGWQLTSDDLGEIDAVISAAKER
ncbi:MAG TPA: aldo/keto reductase [Acidimicrobiia bacterium]|nr:aldo/keto reductase [Acidimicrobiia bacterium]